MGNKPIAAASSAGIRASAFALAVLVAASLPLNGGVVKRTDGQAINGDITLAAPAEVVVASGAGAPAHIPLADCTSISFHASATTAPTTQAGAADLPAPWRHADIGAVSRAGSVKSTGDGAFTMTATGWGLWGGQDSCGFIYQPIRGDADLVAHIPDLAGKDSNISVAVEVRAALGPNAPQAATVLRYTGETRMASRPSTDKPQPFLSYIEPQHWLRIIRQGDDFSSFISADGKTWQLVERRTVAMPPDALWGVCSWKFGNLPPSVMTFDHVSVAAGAAHLTYAPDSPFVAHGVVLTNGTQFTAKDITLADNKLTCKRGDTPISIPLDQTSWIILNPIGAELVKSMAGRTGAVLANGDVFEADLVSIADGKANFNSVVFGPKSFDATTALAAVAVHPIDEAPAKYVAHLSDGTQWRSDTLTIEKDSITLDTPLGAQHVPIADLTVLDIASK